MLARSSPDRRALLSPLGVAHLRLLRASPGGCRPRRGLAYSARRRSIHCGCTRHLSPEIRGHGDHQRAGTIAARPRRFETLGRHPQAVSIPGRRRLPPSFRRQLQRYRYGPGVFKVDWALSQPIPWRAAECLRAGTVHLGGTFDEIAASERQPVVGKVSDRPFVLLSQPTLFIPAGRLRGNTWPGPTAMSPTPGPDSRCRLSSRKWNASRRAFATASWRGRSSTLKPCRSGMGTW